jgi:hypothetical protein
MALRVARGLFRLWLVISVLWLAGVAFTAWDNFKNIDDAETQAMNSWTADVDATRCPDDNPFHSACTSPPSQKEYLAAKANAKKEAAAKEAAAQRQSAIWSFPLLAFLPPAFVLALGAALIWAFSGFRQAGP